MFELEIPASRVFLGADTQLLGTSLAGAKISICLKSLLKLNSLSSASPRSAPSSWDQISDLWPLFWPPLPSKAKTD